MGLKTLKLMRGECCHAARASHASNQDLQQRHCASHSESSICVSTDWLSDRSEKFNFFRDVLLKSLVSTATLGKEEPATNEAPSG